MREDLAVKRYKIADIVFDADVKSKYVESLCENYAYSGDTPPAFKADVTKSDIDFEREKDDINSQNYPDCYYESLALFRKLCNYALKNADGFVFHSSAVEVDGKAYLFTAPSGTGKSTHARLWREMLGDKAVMVNDDKPMIRLLGEKFFVYGTPWMGKHALGAPIKSEIKAICIIEQAKGNSIKRISPHEMLFTALNQTIRPDSAEDMDKLLSLLEKLLSSVGLFKLCCNISREAAELSYKTMSGEENEN